MTNESTIPSTAWVGEIEQLLREVSVIVKRKGREILHHFPITPPQFTALLWLDENGDMTIGELSQKMFLACSTMTDLIDRMENNGLVERVRDSRDRRVVRIHLLDEGSKIIKEVMEARRGYLAEILSHLDKTEIDQIRKSLTILNEEMKK
ncbi:MarR family winged helix-turn-helix transcriptional regulator [Mechercharimyces sp. CAU 1602]|uniref:MarR family winged helix-turn-helix transcriptional regulator n=1 Tax=Mechercharimyces sp. CAU 1602 TaxID=2973933 RepID=UPI002162204D|nr:MarR family winged helix-turn-helix transcriptional regulator [Mechercharimyces sp. CAU 1602]MCS1351482.1 MarR family winged helix-turn-helix transcriptional regulator [Mechercharimyces sp. CAU 1602]